MPCRPAICSHSLGRAWVHNIRDKLDQAARYELDIELFYEDLEYVAKDLPGGITTENLIKAAHTIRILCDERGLSIICLQPFMHYDGLRDREAHNRRVEEMKQWIRLAQILGTTLIALPSTFLSADETSGDLDLITRDMQEIADLGAPYGMQYAYEALAWGTHVDTWEQTWEVVRQVDRPNFGICLDTFNMAARVYADPASPTGRNPHAEADMAASIARLVGTVDVKKIAFVQVVDAERLVEPLAEGHPFYDASQPARMSWSRNCRLFYGEEERGAYLPVKAILEAIVVDLGYEGYLSAELFNRSLTDPHSRTPEVHARRAADSWRKIASDFGLSKEVELLRSVAPLYEEPPRAQL